MRWLYRTSVGACDALRSARKCLTSSAAGDDFTAKYTSIYRRRRPSQPPAFIRCVGHASEPRCSGVHRSSLRLDTVTRRRNSLLGHASRLDDLTPAHRASVGLCLQLPFDCRSTAVRPFDHLRYNRRLACVRAAALRHECINGSAWLRLAGQRPVNVKVTLMTFDKQSNGRRTAEESKWDRSRDHRPGASGNAKHQSRQPACCVTDSLLTKFQLTSIPVAVRVTHAYGCRSRIFIL